MKKILSIIGFLMFASVMLGPVFKHAQQHADFGISKPKIAQAAEPSKGADSSTGCSFPWNSCRLNVPDPDFSTVFATTDPENVGKDLYKAIFNAIEVNPDKKTLEAMATANGMPIAKMSNILAGDLETVLHDNKNLTHQQAIQKVTLYQNQYAEMKQLFDLESEIDLEAGTNEMFANGDESDSGFDLIADLGNIENILFMKNDKIDVGGNFEGGVNGNNPPPDVTGNGNENVNSAQQASQSGSNAKKGNSDQFGNNTQGNGDSSGGGTTDSAGGANANGSGNSIKTLFDTPDPNRCLTPSVTDKALADFNQQQANQDAKKSKNNNTSGSNPDSKAAENQGSSGNNENGSKTKGGNGSGAYDGNSGSAAAGTGGKVEPAAAGDWNTPGKCNDVFCLSVKFVSKPAVVIYGDSDNCIACHVEKMVEKIKYTVTHTLLPGKATGNILEPGICKSAANRMLGMVPFHFYVNVKPVLTPLEDDLITHSNIADEWEKFVNIYKPFKSPPVTSNTTDTFVLETPLERATAEAAAYAAPNVTYQDLTKKINAQLQQMSAIQADEIAVAEASVQSDMSGGFYASVQREMDQMNFFFASFRDIFRSLHEKANADDTGEHACSIIPEIPECGSL